MHVRARQLRTRIYPMGESNVRSVIKSVFPFDPFDPYFKNCWSPSARQLKKCRGPHHAGINHSMIWMERS
jgi:hypothetical protein